MIRTGRLFASLAAVILTASLASCNKPSDGKTDNLDTATREELASLAAKDSRLTGELENKTIKWMANWGFSAEKDPNLVVFQERYGGNIEETIIDWSVRYDKLATAINGDEGIDFFPAGDTDAFPKGAVTTMPGDDVTHPVPDNTGYITEGQFYLKNGRIEPFGSLSRLKQQVNKNTREDHRTLMDAMIKLYAQYKETVEKQSMGFKMSAWDQKLLKYGADFEEKMMDLSVNIDLMDALDLGWKILADNFDKGEVGIPSKLTDRFWPKA